MGVKMPVKKKEPLEAKNTLSGVPKPTKAKAAKVKAAKAKPKRKKSRRQLLEKALNDLWSKLVRKRWGGVCALCGRGRPAAHHFFGKKAYPRVRYTYDNGVALCYHCHLCRVHRNGDTEPARTALIEMIGQDGFDKVRDTAYQGACKYSLDDLEAILADLQQLADMG